MFSAKPQNKFGCSVGLVLLGWGLLGSTGCKNSGVTSALDANTRSDAAATGHDAGAVLVDSGNSGVDTSPPRPDSGPVTDVTAVRPDVVAAADSATSADGTSRPDSNSSLDVGATGRDADVGVDVGGLPLFSFFVTSLVALQQLSGSEHGFGGDLRFGQTGPGAGLRGADAICAAIAERSMPGAAAKQWRAFLSVVDDGNGQTVHAIDRIGEGPWYDRVGRLLAPTRADLLGVRPQNGHPAIQNDLPNEDGIPNHQPDPSEEPVDNHHMLTGSNEAGELQSAYSTCLDWTTRDGDPANGDPRCGFSWPRGAGSRGNDWKSGFSAPGCAAGVDLGGVPEPGDDFVGAGGGYGGFYCFALLP